MAEGFPDFLRMGSGWASAPSAGGVAGFPDFLRMGMGWASGRGADCARYRVTYQTWNLRTCTMVTQWTEAVECCLSDLVRETLHSRDCTLDPAAGGLSASCCGVAAGAGDGYTVEYTTYNFGTCEVTNQECRPLEDCTYCDPDPIGSGLFPTTMYCVSQIYYGPPEFPPLTYSQVMPFMGWPVVEMNYNPTPLTPIGNYDWYGGISPAAAGPRYCLIDVFSMSVGGTVTHPLECSILYAGGYPEPDLPCTEDNFSAGYRPFGIGPDAYISLHPDQLYMEFAVEDLFTTGLIVPGHVIVDAAGLSTPPRKLTSCPVRDTPLPASLTFTIPSVGPAPITADAGSYTLSFSDGAYRGGKDGAAFFLAGDFGYVADPSLKVAVRWQQKTDYYLPVEYFQTYDFLASDIVSCDPILIVNSDGVTITE